MILYMQITVKSPIISGNFFKSKSAFCCLYASSLTASTIRLFCSLQQITTKAIMAITCWMLPSLVADVRAKGESI